MIIQDTGYSTNESLLEEVYIQEEVCIDPLFIYLLLPRYTMI
jgi:hypothetical protein